MDSGAPASPAALSAPDKVLYKAEKAQAMKAIHELPSFMNEPVENVKGDYLQTKQINIDRKDRGGIPTLRAEEIRRFKQIRIRALDKKITELAIKPKIFKYNPRTNTEAEMSAGEAAGLEAQLRREFFAALGRKLPVSQNVQASPDRSAAATANTGLRSPPGWPGGATAGDF